MSDTDYSWDAILEMANVTHKTSTDQEWEEAKMNAIDCALHALIYKLRRKFPDDQPDLTPIQRRQNSGRA